MIKVRRREGETRDTAHALIRSGKPRSTWHAPPMTRDRYKLSNLLDLRHHEPAATEFQPSNQEA